jgi:hypothetical protein
MRVPPLRVPPKRVPPKQVPPIAKRVPPKQVPLKYLPFFVYLGMALISMCFSLIQETVGQSAAKVGASVGLGQSEYIEIDVVVPQPRIANYFER